MKLILFLCFYIPISAFPQIITQLNQNWEFRQIGKEKWYPAAVPGYVHVDLFNNKLIEDPFFGQNETALKWIENEDWEYKTTFSTDDKFLKNSHIELIFEGLDTYTSIYLNSKPVLHTDNMFHEWVIDCKNLLKRGKNEILIQFFSPAKIIQNKIKNQNFTQYTTGNYFIRKATFQFGCEFAPQFISSGICKPVFIKTWNFAVINNIQTIQKSLEEKKATLSIIFEIIADKPIKADILINNQNLNTTQIKKAVSLKKGTNYINAEYVIDNPKLWWTNGLGDAYLYNITCNLVIQKQIVDSENISLGLRTLEIVHEKDSSGSGFYFKLNGFPVFIKGAVYVPQDLFTARVDSIKQEKLIADAKDINLNMLQVSNSGIYQDNSFYDLCDKNGILVLQDFMLSDTLFSGDSLLTESVKQETIYQIKRLRNHTCIALWYGNNENLFHTIIPDIIKKYDSQREYLQNSQKNNRFMNEHSFQGMPDIQTINSMVSDDEKDIDSKSILAHQKSADGFKTIQIHMDREYKQPKDFKKFVYVSGLLQAYTIKTDIESDRRTKPYCMGSLYRQFNDCWPGITCSGIDYFGRWKPLQYFIKTAFSKIIISVIEENEEIKIYIVSDKQQKQFGSLTLKAVDFSGKEYWKKNFIAEVPVNSSKMIYKVKTEEVIANRHRQKTVFIAELKEKDSLIAKEVFYFAPPKDLKLSKPEIKQEIHEEKDKIYISLKTENLLKNVYLSIDGEATFSNNYFDIMPDEKIDIICNTKLSLEEVKSKFQIYSLFDSFITK